jgi:hypothetical protein
MNYGLRAAFTSQSAQCDDLGVQRVLGIDLVSAAQVACGTDSGRGSAAHQGNVLVFTFRIGQLEAVFPVANGLSSAKFVDLLLGRRTYGRMGVKFL